MAAGDLITRNGQYEFNGLLLNDSLSDLDTVRVISTSGLFSLPDMKTSDSELQDDHGGSVGRDLLGMRPVVMDLRVIASTKANMYNKLEAIAAALQPQSTLIPLVFQRAGIGKRLLNVRPRRLGGFDTSAALDHGSAEGSVMFLAPDPRKLALPARSQGITIAASGTTNSGTLAMNGNFQGGAKPIISIAGPITNPRITNAADGARTLRIDQVITAGQTLIVNAFDRTVMIAGFDYSANVRSDNQWWNLLPGDNLITVTRSNSPATAATVTFDWWDSFV
jgi:tail protein